MGFLDNLRKRQKRTEKAEDLKGGIIKGVNIVKFTKELEPIKNYKRYMLIKFKKFEDGDPVGEYTHSFFAIDLASNFLASSVDDLIVTGYLLVKAIVGDDYKKHYNPFKGLIDSEDEADYSHAQIMSKIQERKFTKQLEQNIVDQVSEVIEKFLDSGEEKLFNIKLVYTSKGKTKFGGENCIEAAEENGLSISSYEERLIKQFSK